jgi:hypothetical protein
MFPHVERLKKNKKKLFSGDVKASYFFSFFIFRHELQKPILLPCKYQIHPAPTHPPIPQPTFNLSMLSV